MAQYGTLAGWPALPWAAESAAATLGLMFAGEFESRLVLTFLFAFDIGIAFHYFTIVPMCGLSFGKGLAAAAKADTMSIVLFEISMFGWLAITCFLISGSSSGPGHGGLLVHDADRYGHRYRAIPRMHG